MPQAEVQFARFPARVIVCEPGMRSWLYVCSSVSAAKRWLAPTSEDPALCTFIRMARVYCRPILSVAVLAMDLARGKIVKALAGSSLWIIAATASVLSCWSVGSPL